MQSKCCLHDPIEYSEFLEQIRLSTKGDDDTKHFKRRGRERGIKPAEIEKLRFYGELIAVRPSHGNHPKNWDIRFTLQWKRANGRIIEGVFASDGFELRGITIYNLTPKSANTWKANR